LRPGRPRKQSTSRHFERLLADFRDTTSRDLLSSIPENGPPYLYDLVSLYPSRPAKGLRAALCFATCAALGGSRRQALNSAVAIELLHNAFLIHDDVQDGSELRRGRPTLFQEHGVPIAVNVGNATNLLALRRLMENRGIVGPAMSWKIMEETERLMTLSLEGQAIELGWIRDNRCNLRARDYMQMCLKKTSWYSVIYPMRVGALVARSGLRYKSIDYARRQARQLAGAALLEAVGALRGVPDCEEKRFILEMILYVVNRDR
jgi:geranylgeranyl diphosphate synthase type II